MHHIWQLYNLDAILIKILIHVNFNTMIVWCQTSYFNLIKPLNTFLLIVLTPYIKLGMEPIQYYCHKLKKISFELIIIKHEMLWLW